MGSRGLFHEVYRMGSKSSDIMISKFGSGLAGFGWG